MLQEISKSELINFQQKWGQSVIKIGQLFIEKKNYKEAAENLVETLYGYKEGAVLFKPTLAQYQQFRLDTIGALSYFIGDNPDFAEDKGFALQPWVKVRFENHGFVLNGNCAMIMGNYYFTDTNGNEKKVEYTFGVFRNADGQLKINVHHSSLPFTNT